jgi:N-acetylneuraminic acid mutarotase
LRGRTMAHNIAALALLLLATGCSDEETMLEPVSSGVAELTAGSWVQKAPLLTGRTALAAAAVNRPSPVLYAIGGDVDGRTLATVEAFDLTTNTWTTKAPLPARLESTNGAAVIGGKIYVSGGRDLDNNSPGSDDGAPRSSLYVYDPATDGWSRKADMPLPSMHGVSGVIDGRLYVLNPLYRRFYRYDPGSDTWTALARCPNPHPGGAATVIGGKLYVAGGYSSADMTYPTKSLHVYDPKTNTWTAKALLPRGVAFARGARLDGKLYVIGGSGPSRGLDLVQAYDPATDTWTEMAPLPSWRTGLASSQFVNVNGRERIVAAGGYGGTGERWLKSNDVYAP